VLKLDAGSWACLSIVWWSKPDTCWWNLWTAAIELQLVNLFGNFEKLYKTTYIISSLCLLSKS